MFARDPLEIARFLADSDLRLPPECRLDPECRSLCELRARPEILVAADSGSGTELAVQTRLRKEFPEELVRLAVAIRQLRRRAEGKFSRADRMWFDRVGLEQSTAEAVAKHKAKRFPAGAAVWDLCCGIGSDTCALAELSRVTAVDHRPVACLRTWWNADVYQVEQNLETRCADVTALALGHDWIHIDPDRRIAGGARANRVEDYVPGLDFLRRLMDSSQGGAIKVGPASNFGGKFPGTEIELISLHGECKEATVWFGGLAGSDLFRATVLPSGETLAGHPLSAAAPVTPLQTYLYDPDPAVVRAGLVDLCAERLGLKRLDSAEEYLTGETRVDSPFVTPFEVLAEFPNNERALRRHLQDAAYGAYEIKCRHLPVQAETLRRKLPTKGHETATIFLARVAGQARWILARRAGTA